MRLLKLDDLPSSLQDRLVRRVLSPREILLQQNEPANYLYWVATGRVRLVSFVNQQMITHYFVEAGELFGESALYIPTY